MRWSRKHTASVALVVADDAVATAVHRLLATRVIVYLCPPGAYAHEGDVIVVAAKEVTPVLPLLYTYADASRPLLLAYGGPATGLRALAQAPPVSELLLFHELKEDLWRAVQRCVDLLPRYGLLRRVQTSTEADPILRSLTGKLMSRADCSRRSAMPVATVSEAATLVGCSRSHLYRVARQAGVDLRRLFDAVRVFAAVEAYSIHGPPWETIARRLGYSTGAGLTALASRTHGTGSRGLAAIPMEEATRAVLSELFGDHEAADDDLRAS